MCRQVKASLFQIESSKLLATPELTKFINDFDKYFIIKFDA